MGLEEWVERHQLDGHRPHSAPTHDNPENWECDCGTVWRILTIKQTRRKFAHLRWCPTSAREAQRLQLQAHIAEIQAEQEARNAELHKVEHSHIPPLRIAERYAAGRSRALRRD